MVLARFSKKVAIGLAVGGIALAILIVALVTHPVPWHHSDGLFGKYTVVIMYLLAILLITKDSVLLYQVFFRDAAAIWLTGDELIYFNQYSVGWFTRIARSGIETVSLEPNAFIQEAIVFSLVNNGQSSIRTWMLSEPADALIPRIRMALAQNAR